MENEALKSFINEAASIVNTPKKITKQPFDPNFRNAIYYQNLFSTMGMDEAYDVIVRNGKIPTFEFELECAIREYETFYGVPFKSKVEREKDALERENEELKQKLAEREAAIPAVTDEQGTTIDPENFPVGMNQDEFKEFFMPWFTKSQGHEPHRLVVAKAWKRYQKKSGESGDDSQT